MRLSGDASALRSEAWWPAEIVDRAVNGEWTQPINVKHVVKSGLITAG